MQEIVVFAQKPYHIYLGSDLFSSEKFLTVCRESGSRCVIVTEENLQAIYAINIAHHLKTAGVKVDIISIPGGEENKTREMKAFIEDQLLDLSCGRDTVLLALGGGVILDIVGFVAATYCRGVPVIYLPTTLLAMVDASIGGKTGINVPHGKNLIGTFTQPHAVFIDIDTLKTLPAREFKSGMAEVIKHAAVFDRHAFKALENRQTDNRVDMICHSCEIKKHIVEQDEKESGLRQLLNFGHTIGHALEAASDYQLKHGEAVALGMWLESALAVKLKYMNPQAFERMKKILRQYDIVSTQNMAIDFDKALAMMQFDKKVRQEKIHIVMLKDIGEPHVENGRYSHIVDVQMIRDLFESLNHGMMLTC